MRAPHRQSYEIYLIHRTNYIIRMQVLQDTSFRLFTLLRLVQYAWYVCEDDYPVRFMNAAHLFCLVSAVLATSVSAQQIGFVHTRINVNK